MKLLLAVAAAALLFFWTTGAHSRLLALRKNVDLAAARLTDVVALRHAALTQLLAVLLQSSRAQAALSQPALLQPLATEAVALQALNGALADEQLATRALAARALDAAAAAAWLAAQAPLDACAARVLALLDQHPELAQEPAVAQPLQAARATQPRLQLLRHAYNEAAGEHNRALLQIPTRWLVRAFFRFAPAGLV